MTWEMAGRAATYLAALGVFGTLGLRWLIARANSPGVQGDAAPALRTLGLIFATGLVAATLARALCQSLMVWGAADGLSWESLRTVAFESRWGGRWQWQPIAALVTWIGFGLHRWLPRAGWMAATLGALSFAVALPMTGHAYGHPTNWIAQSLHILGFGLWLGTLTVALIAPTRPLSSGESSAASRQRWLESFAPLAGSGAIAVIVSGTVLSLASFPSWSSLLHSGYGRAYLVKVGLVVVIVALGARNFRALRAGKGAGLRRAAGLEATLAVLVLLVTAILTALPQPDMVH